MEPNDLVLSGRRTLQKEAEALQEFVRKLDGSFANACEEIFQCQGTVLLTGMGKSGLVARKWASTFSGTGTRSYFINPAEASHGDLGILYPQDLLIALSNSGETAELSDILRHARETGVNLIAVTSQPDSSLARQASLVLSVQVSEEACPLGLSPTTSTTIMMALGDALAVTLMQMRGFTEADFARLHPGGSLGRRFWLRVSDLMHAGDSIPVVKPEDAWESVLVEMTQKRLGLAVVLEDDAVQGIITDGDLRRFLQKKSFTQSSTAKDMMTTSPKTIHVKALAMEARELMEKHLIHHLLIQDDQGKLCGVLHFQDLLRAKVL